MLTLSPSQQKIVRALSKAQGDHRLFVLWCRDGLGRTAMLEALKDQWGGVILGAQDVLSTLAGTHPLGIEEALSSVVSEALERANAVFLDDLHLILHVIEGGCHFYPRTGLVEGVFSSWRKQLFEKDKRLVIGVDSIRSLRLQEWGYPYGFQDFAIDDYRHLFRHYLGDEKERLLDFEKVIRFFPSLNLHHIRRCGLVFSKQTAIETRQVLDWLRDHIGGSNVDTGKVEAVDLRELRGVDNIIESLEANLVLPIVDDELATRLRLRPKRGILLYGPPGTGKTTIGRALAHRLGSKFFLLDGNVIAGTAHFYQQVLSIFNAAKLNRPSVIFIDDSDVIFESQEELGLYRFLLSHLDGLESEGINDICLVLTAMRVSQLPPALIRSGRVELWLEMRLPDPEARRLILNDRLTKDFPGDLERPDVERLLADTEGLTGADLRRLIVDARHLLAYDLSNRRPTQPMDAYFKKALDGIRDNKQKLLQAESERGTGPHGAKGGLMFPPAWLLRQQGAPKKAQPGPKRLPEA